MSNNRNSEKGTFLTLDMVLVVGSIAVALVLLVWFLPRGVNLVRYYMYLDSRLNAEILGGLASSTSLAPEQYEIQYQLKVPKPDWKCELRLNDEMFGMETGKEVKKEGVFVKYKFPEAEIPYPHFKTMKVNKIKLSCSTPEGKPFNFSVCKNKENILLERGKCYGARSSS